MKKAIIWAAVPALVLLAALVYLLWLGERDATYVRDRVVRFHVVANSDSDEDQQLKLKVRDGVFALVQQLFTDCQSQEEALTCAEENKELLQAEAQRILVKNGSQEPVQVAVQTRFFPTKSYGTFSFPAGRYQAVSIWIGEGAGQNFWCVLYPALCVSPAVEKEQGEQEMTAVVGEEGTTFLEKTNEKQQIKFALVEWFENLRQKYLKT